MPRIYPGYSPNTTVTNTSISSSNQIEYDGAPGMYLYITEIDFYVDSTMQSNGSILGFVGSKGAGAGQPIVADFSTGAAINLAANFSQPFAPPFELVIEPNQSLCFQYAVSSGTGHLQIVVTGQLLTAQEHEQRQIYKRGIGL